jgi:tetratricopeptide (TPR) repeat protein
MRHSVRGAAPARSIPTSRWGRAALLAIFILVVAPGGATAQPVDPGAEAGGGTSSAVTIRIAAEDRALWSDVNAGRFTKQSFAEAALLASGVRDPAERAGYLRRLEALEQQARQAVAGARTPFERGEKLLLWLHGESRPLAKYVETQTDLSVLLDTGTYNCVSSAVLYNLLGRRLGLDLRAVEVSDHAFSVLYDGEKSADVETTTRLGFNPSRDRKASGQSGERAGPVYIRERHKNQRRLIDEAGLVAAIYFNHAVLKFREERYAEALAASVCAMNLDPDAFAAKQAYASLARWTVGLAREGRLEEAVRVLDEAGAMINNPAGVKKVTWGVYDAAARDLFEQADWPGAIALYDEALKRLPGDRHLEKNQQAAWDGWGRGYIESGQWAKAIGVYRDALKTYPKNRAFLNNIKYCEQKMNQPRPAVAECRVP